MQLGLMDNGFDTSICLVQGLFQLIKNTRRTCGYNGSLACSLPHVHVRWGCIFMYRYDYHDYCCNQAILGLITEYDYLVFPAMFVMITGDDYCYFSAILVLITGDDYCYFSAILVLIYAMLTSVRMVEAAGRLHSLMLDRMIRAPMEFFDTTPTGRIINRFSSDMETIDTTLPLTFRITINSLYLAITTVIVICINTPLIFTVVLPVLILYGVILVSS